MSNQWFKNKYLPTNPIEKGIQVGIDDDISLHSNVLIEMKKDPQN
jgi:hypothetical protein